MDDKTKARAYKLLELAKRGVGGEAANAQRFLEKLLAKHGLTLADMLNSEDQAPAPVLFKPKNDQHKSLFFQVLAKVLNTHDIRYKSKPRSRHMVVDLTPSQHAEVLTHMAVLEPALKKHMKTAFLAFVHANALHSDGTSRDPDDDSAPPMPKEDLAALLQMIQGTTPTPVHKALTA